MGRIGKCTLGCRILFFPVSTAHIPVGKPFFFCLQILHFHIEDTVVGNECLEALVVMSGQPIHRKSSEAGTYTTQTITIHKRLFGHFVDSREIILHTLTTVITADSLVPFQSEARKSATIRSYDDITVGGHNLHVPTITPELAYRTLRTTFAEEQCRVLFIRIELRRIDDPCQHLFAVSCFHPAAFYFTHFDLVIDLLVLLGQLRGLSVQSYCVNFVTHTH